ncbi:MAG: MBOAT family O-acyltransferase [Campylobacter sp.]
MLSYTFQLYFDFSGYCDMAIGVALIFNIKLPINFNSPYKALNIQDFWRRWHINLSRFLKDYAYIPLGGNHKDVARTYVNLMVTFVIGGIWHKAG